MHLLNKPCERFAKANESIYKWKSTEIKPLQIEETLKPVWKMPLNVDGVVAVTIPENFYARS